MIILFFVVCSLSHCQNVRQPFDGTIYQCMLYGQQPINDWLNEHPGYLRWGGYRCGPDRKDT